MRVSAALGPWSTSRKVGEHVRLRYVRSALRSAADCLRVGAVAIWPESRAQPPLPPPAATCVPEAGGACISGQSTSENGQRAARAAPASDQENLRGGVSLATQSPWPVDGLMRAVLVHTEPDVAGSRRLAEVNLW